MVYVKTKGKLVERIIIHKWIIIQFSLICNLETKTTAVGLLNHLFSACCY